MTTNMTVIDVEDLLIATGRATDITDALNAKFPLLPRHMVLEVGCGTGKHSMNFASTIGCHATLLDYDQRVIERSQRIKWAVEGILAKDIPVWHMKGDMLDLPWDDNTFHLVHNEGSLEHFKSPLVPLREMVRVSRDAVVAVIPNAKNETQMKLAREQSAEYSKANPTHWAAYEKPMTVDEVHSLFDDAGLINVEAFPVWYERNPPRGVEDYRMVFGIGRKHRK